MHENEKLIILGAGKPHVGNIPSAMQNTELAEPLLKWQIDACGFTQNQVIFIAGYKAKQIQLNFPDLRIIKNKDWELTGSAASLLLAPFDTEESLIVSYSDIMFRSRTISDLRNTPGDIIVAFDSTQNHAKFSMRQNHKLQAREEVVLSGSDVLKLVKDIDMDWTGTQFIGLVKLNKKAIEHLKSLRSEQLNEINKMSLVELLEILRLKGLSVQGIDVKGDWAEFVNGDEIANFVLGTKAESLSRLEQLVRLSSIQEQITLTVAQWNSSKNIQLSRIKNYFQKQALIVRSSALNEDGFANSNAGGFDSVLNVDPEVNLSDAIEHVVSSYGKDVSDLDQILVQPMVNDVICSGVVFTQTLEHAAPWYVINFEENGDTTAITSGNSRDHRTIYVRRGGHSHENIRAPFSNLLAAVEELEQLVNYGSLDIEFAIDASYCIHILQVRPIVKHKGRKQNFRATDYDLAMNDAKDHFINVSTAMPQFPGSPSPLFANMPDWNPAEIIGTSPNLLASSTYQYLITDEIWAQQRAEYGYRDVRPAPLLIKFAGQPYVDVRASFASFIPASINDKLAEKLLKFYLNWLRANPELHDKVEFDVVPTCLTANFQKWRQRLSTSASLTKIEIEQLEAGLRDVTETAFRRTSSDLDTVEILKKRFDATVSNEFLTETDRLILHCNDCRYFGTLPFAHLARSGFVAVTLLKDAAAAGVISNQAVDDFLLSLETVSQELQKAARTVALGELDWNEFVKEFGHLRPGSYDVTALRYIDDPEYYLKPLVDAQRVTTEKSPNCDSAWEKEKMAFFASLKSLGLPSDPNLTETFLRNAIQGREFAKFVFSKSLSAILECVARIGNSFDLNREEVAHLSLNDFLQIRSASHDMAYTKKVFKEKSQYNRRMNLISMGCKLPPIITQISDFDFFELGSNVANFVGSNSVVAACIDLSKKWEDVPDLLNKIVLIEKADPGYDWVFGKGICGLITMYGGANSHMAIRSAEFGIAAAIGVGEQHFRKLSAAKMIELSPAHSTMRIIQ